MSGNSHTGRHGPPQEVRVVVAVTVAGVVVRNVMGRNIEAAAGRVKTGTATIGQGGPGRRRGLEDRRIVQRAFPPGAAPLRRA